jgi:hypothetical protein
MLMRLLTFRPTASGDVTDQFLRGTLLPGLIGSTGLRHAFAGRAMGEAASRMVLSVWDASAGDDLSDLFPFETGTVVTRPVVETFRASLALTFGQHTEGQIIRVFRGQAREGRAEAYLHAVRDGTLADVEAGGGPSALFLGMVDEDRFVTVSVWASWQRIEDAMGGNIRQPIATRYSELLVEGAAEHFEVVPNTLELTAGRDVPRRPGTPGEAHAP